MRVAAAARRGLSDAGKPRGDPSGPAPAPAPPTIENQPSPPAPPAQQNASLLQPGEKERWTFLTEFQARLAGNGSFVLVAVSFLATDMLTLRSLNVLAGVLMFLFNHSRNNGIGMKWGAFLGAINVVQIWFLRRDRRVGILPPREADAFSRFFEDSRLLSETNFWALADIGEWQNLHCGTHITLQDCPNEWVYLLVDGELQVHRHCDGSHVERLLGTISPGSWVGERGFLRQFALPRLLNRDNLTAPSFATVTVSSPTARVLRWRRSELQVEMERVSATGAAVLLSMTRDVVQKLRVQSEINSEDHALEWNKWNSDVFQDQARARRGDRKIRKDSQSFNEENSNERSIVRAIVATDAWRGICRGDDTWRIKNAH